MTADSAPMGPRWQLVPMEPTPEMIAAATTATVATPNAADFELARAAARIVMTHPDIRQGTAVEEIAATMATIIPAHRAMLAAVEVPRAAIALVTQVNTIEDLLDELRVARSALADFAGLTEPHAHALARRFAATIAKTKGRP